MQIDLSRTAVLSLDVQEGIIAMVPDSSSSLPAAAKVAEAARRAGLVLIHVGLGFEPGYPEIPAGSRFEMMKEKNLFLKGSDSSRFHPSVYKEGDLVIYKHRVSAFAGNSLELILRSKKIDTLVLFGFATSGIVLSTVRQAADLDFKFIVIKDACGDRDPEVHRVLTEKVFSSHGTVTTAAEFEASLS